MTFLPTCQVAVTKSHLANNGGQLAE